MTEGKKEAAVQGDKSAQAEWAVEEVSEFYSAVEGGNISEIREEAMGLLRLTQHWPDNADVRLTVQKVIKDINKVFPTEESFNETFDKWKAAKVKKGQAKEGVYVEDLKKTLEEIGQKIPEERPRYFIYKYGGRTKREVSKNIKELEAKHGKGFAYDRDIGVEGESRKEVRAKFKKQLDSMPKGSTVIVDDTHGIGRLMQEEINYAKKLGLNIQYETSLGGSFKFGLVHDVEELGVPKQIEY